MRTVALRLSIVLGPGSVMTPLTVSAGRGDERGAHGGRPAAPVRPAGLPTPAWFLHLGARLIRTEAELVLKSRWVSSRRLLDAGFRFTHPTLGPALDDILARDRVAASEPVRAD